VITLLTDFGLADTYVGQLRGVILQIAPAARIIDLTHQVPPQDVGWGAVQLDRCVDAFPPDAIHIAIVDPGVGSERSLVAVETPCGRFVAPNNGILAPTLRRHSPTLIVQLTNRAYWRDCISNTFHGRDILAPVAAHWLLGSDPALFGPRLSGSQLADLPAARPECFAGGFRGRVELIDSFGNLLTNLPLGSLTDLQRKNSIVELADRRISGVDRCYSDRPAGTLMALGDSCDRLEIAVSEGSAARETGTRVGTAVVLRIPIDPTHDCG
jgi:S-adenosylmethionine hydrolase